MVLEHKLESGGEGAEEMNGGCIKRMCKGKVGLLAAHSLRAAPELHIHGSHRLGYSTRAPRSASHIQPI